MVSWLALSNDEEWIAAGTSNGLFFLDAKTHEKVSTHKEDTWFYAVDFSPDSTRVVGGSRDGLAAIWAVTSGKQVQRLHHNDWVKAAKYSLQGARIVTATEHSIKVWDTNDGHLLVDIPVELHPGHSTSLLWSNNHIFVVSDGKIKEFDASSGSPASEWTAPKSIWDSCFALSHHGEFLAHSSNDTVTFWDTSTHTQLGFIRHTQDIRSITFSPGDRLLAIGGSQGKITIKEVNDVPLSSYCTVSIVYLRLALLPIHFALFCVGHRN